MTRSLHDGMSRKTLLKYNTVWYTVFMEGLKYDDAKPPMDLLDRRWLEETAKVLDFGARKYVKHNWRKGISVSRLVAAALRHIHAYNDGEDTDPETGLNHLAHASCCLMFLVGQNKPETDDRYKNGI